MPPETDAPPRQGAGAAGGQKGFNVQAGLLQARSHQVISGATGSQNIWAPWSHFTADAAVGDGGMIRAACSQLTVHIPAAPLTPSTTASDAMIAARDLDQSGDSFPAKLSTPPAVRNVYRREETTSRKQWQPVVAVVRGCAEGWPRSETFVKFGS